MIFTPKPDIDPMTVIRMVQTLPKVYALDGQDKLRIKLQLESQRTYIRASRAKSSSRCADVPRSNDACTDPLSAWFRLPASAAA